MTDNKGKQPAFVEKEAWNSVAEAAVKLLDMGVIVRDEGSGNYIIDPEFVAGVTAGGFAPRPANDISEAEQELAQRVWYDHSVMMDDGALHSSIKMTEEQRRGTREARQKVANELGEDKLGPYTDFEWGMLNGKLSALRWVMGEEWDMLDT